MAKILPRALNLCKQLRKEDEPYLLAMTRKTPFVRRIEEFKDETDEAEFK
jgi:hypothetical protein